MAGVRSDRAYYYGADGTLRVSDYRVATLASGADPFRVVFEEYRYDALGRRVVVRMQRLCDKGYSLNPCNWGTVRRTVWHGSAEVYEIQSFGSQTGYGEGVLWADTAAMENDTLPQVKVYSPNGSTLQYDASPNFGRVAYTHGSQIDQPLSAIRINFTIAKPRVSVGGWDTVTLAPLAVSPHWNWRGQADFGTFADGGWRQCPIYSATDSLCVAPPWRIRGFMYAQQPADQVAPQWWGTPA